MLVKIASHIIIKELRIPIQMQTHKKMVHSDRNW